MRKLFLSIIASIMMASGLVAAAPSNPANASATTFTYVEYSNRSGFNERIMVKCHSDLAWHAMHIGDNSKQVCPGVSGWVNSIWVPDGGYLEVQNWSTGNVTQYGNCYKGSIGGGNYYAWVTNFPLNNNCP